MQFRLSFMEHDNAKTCVYFDGAYSSCVKDRNSNLRFAGKTGREAKWLDTPIKTINSLL